MSKTLAIVIGLILLIALLLFSMTYTVQYHEVAIKTRFGQTTSESVETEPGLKFRLPLFAEKVSTFDTRLQLRESPMETVQTADGQQVIVRAFLLWRVDAGTEEGPLKFFASYSSIDEANASISDQFKTAMRSGLSRFTFTDLIGAQNRLGEAEAAVASEMAALRSKGIEPVKVGISQLVLPVRTAQAVLTRMNTTRQALSDAERGKGQAEAAAIQNRATADVEKIKAFAEQRAAAIRALGEQQAAEYLATMAQAEDLAIFLQWCDTLQQSLSRYTTLVLPTSFAPLHLLNLDTPLDGNGIPQPATTQPGVASTTAPPSGVTRGGLPSIPARGPSQPEQQPNQERSDG